MTTILEAEQRKRIKKLEKTLHQLARVSYMVLAAMDAEMKKPSDHARGSRISHICNALDTEADIAMRFTMGYGWNRINNMKAGK